MNTILDSPEVAKLVTLVEEAARSTEEGVKRFVEPAQGTLRRATNKRQHMIFGRRGSGKSSLLRKAAADLTVDRRPIEANGRTDGTDPLATVPSTSAFPRLQLGRLLHYMFRGLLSVHSCYNLQTCRVALCDPLHRRLQRLRCLHRCSDCYRVERSSSRAGLFSRCGLIGFCELCQQACDIGISNGASRESAVNFFGQRHGSTSRTKLRRHFRRVTRKR